MRSVSIIIIEITAPLVRAIIVVVVSIGTAPLHVVDFLYYQGRALGFRDRYDGGWWNRILLPRCVHLVYPNLELGQFLSKRTLLGLFYGSDPFHVVLFSRLPHVVGGEFLDYRHGIFT